MSEEATPRELEVPELSLVVLVGASGSGKSTFAQRHFLPTEVLSSDFCRGLVADDENDQSATKDAFEVLHFIAAKRMAAGRLTVIDATNVKREDRGRLVKLAREFHFLPTAIVFDLPERLCQDRNRGRSDRDFGSHVIRNQTRDLRRGLRGIRKEGFRQVHVLSSPEDVEAASINRTRLWNNRTDEEGPFDIIGDVHGCFVELEQLLGKLGYQVIEEREGEFPDGGAVYAHPEGRTAVFVGDLVDRGTRILDTIRLVRNMVEHGSAHCVPGNHDQKLVRKLRGRDVQITHGLDRSLAELDALPDDRRDAAQAEVVRFLDALVSHYVFDGGQLVVAHAGMKEEMQGRGSRKVRDFALYGETTGETNEFGLPVRWNWAAEYRGRAVVVYGHTPVPEAEWLNRTINIDTGCVFGGRLTALRYPEKELVSVPAGAIYSQPAKPFLPEGEAPPDLTVQQREDELLDIDDVLGKRIISTRLARNVTIREQTRSPRSRSWDASPSTRSGSSICRRRSRRRPPPARPTFSSTPRRRFRITGRKVSRRLYARRSTWARVRSSSSVATRMQRAVHSVSLTRASARASRALAAASLTATISRRRSSRTCETPSQASAYSSASTATGYCSTAS